MDREDLIVQLKRAIEEYEDTGRPDIDYKAINEITDNLYNLGWSDCERWGRI